MIVSATNALLPSWQTHRRPALGIILSALAALLVLAAACGSDEKRADDFPAIKNPLTVTPGQKVNLVATTTQIADFARVVGGDRVTVTDLIKPGIDPHEFEPTPQNAQSVAQANLIAINGIGLEAFMAKLLQQAGADKPVAVLSKGVKIRKGSGDEEKEGDPHIWYNPQNAKIMVTNLADALGKVDPAGASAYKANADVYNKQLDALDKSIQEQITTIPKDRRKMVTNHDAFGYYIDHYGLKFVGSVIPSLETNAQPSAQETANLIRKIQQEKVPAIFTEAAVNPKLEEQIAKDAGVKVVATLCADSLSDASGPCPTYLALMQHDTKTIVDALR